MAKLNFSTRFSSDKSFKTAVEKIHLEAVLESAGISPETLCDAWESGVRPLTLSQYREHAKPAVKTRKTRQTKKALNTDAPIKSDSRGIDVFSTPEEPTTTTE